MEADEKGARDADPTSNKLDYGKCPLYYSNHIVDVEIGDGQHMSESFLQQDVSCVNLHH